MRLSQKTGSLKWVSLVGALACLGALGTLIWERAKTSPKELWALVVLVVLSFTIEAVYRKRTGRVMIPES